MQFVFSLVVYGQPRLIYPLLYRGGDQKERGRDRKTSISPTLTWRTVKQRH